MVWIKWIGWAVATVVGVYLAIVVLFVLYFALASYIPLLYRKVRRLFSPPGEGPDAQS